MPEVIDRIASYFDSISSDDLVGLYLCGSSIVGGLQRDSDIDVLAVTSRSLSTEERSEITDLLLRFSGRRATVEPGRPIELTSVVHSELAPWRYPPVCDYQYGEWLRDEFAAGQLPAPHPDPDLTILIIAARTTSQPLRGPAFDEITEPVPQADLRRAIHDSLKPLLADLHGDERNVLLTLARMVVTLETGDIVSKDDAAHRVMSGLPPHSQALMDLARQAYLGLAVDDWTQNRGQTQETADLLAAHVRRL